jgi:phosphate:Na+ symporter
MDIEVSYPAVCAGGLILILFGSRKTYRYISYFLFLDLVYCLSGCPYENSHGSTGKSFDFSHYATMSLAVYLLVL